MQFTFQQIKDSKDLRKLKVNLIHCNSIRIYDSVYLRCDDKSLDRTEFQLDIVQFNIRAPRPCRVVFIVLKLNKGRSFLAL